MEWLRKQEAWQLKARLLRHRITKSIVVNNPNIHWQTDLVDFQKYNDKNDDYRYVMTVVDLFSKYAYAKPLRDKEGKTVAKAMKEILEANKNPKVIQADNGSEFISEEFKELCDRKGIKIIHSKPYTPSTQGAIERFNKTLKEKLHWYKLQYATTKWIDILDKMITNYNNSYHNTTNFTPTYLNGNPSDHNLQLARDRIRKIAKDRIASEPQKFKVGDKVRISQRVLGNKDRIGGLRLNWTKETYTVMRVISGNVYALPRYILNNGGSYSPYDIQKIDIDKLERIQEMMKNRILNFLNGKQLIRDQQGNQ
jgi:transposase InsO family protein